MAGVAMIGASACCEIEDGFTDIDSWPMPRPTYDPKVYTINHPAMLHSATDIDYTKSHLGQQPWSDAYQKLLSSGYSYNTYKASPVKYLARLDNGNWGDGGGRWDDAACATNTIPVSTTTTPTSSATALQLISSASNGSSAATRKRPKQPLRFSRTGPL